MKLNIGSGGLNFDGYINVDPYDERADIKADMRSLPFDNESAEEVIAYHCLEHVNPYQFNDALNEFYRVLKPGGKLIIEMPNIIQLCKAFENADKLRRYHLLNLIYGYSEHLGHHHYYGWYEESVIDHLIAHGFENCASTEPQTHLEDRWCCMRVEATKCQPHRQQEQDF